VSASAQRTFTARVLFERAPEIDAPPGARIQVRSEKLDAARVEKLARAAWYWPEAASELARHGAQVEVALCCEIGTPIDRALAVTKAAASIATHPGAIAVLWDATDLVHDAAQWISQSDDATRDDLPLFLWLAFEGRESDTGRTLGTRGVSCFGEMEVEVPETRRDGEEVLEIVCDVALYVLTSPVPPEDGEPIDVTNGRVRVRVEPSLKNDGTKAYRLRLS
jgi:hypothetical protein